MRDGSLRGNLGYPHQVIGVDTKGLPILRCPNPSMEALEKVGGIPIPQDRPSPRYGPHPPPARGT